MIKFAKDESLGPTVSSVKCWCFGVEPVNMWQLRLAAGGSKFSQLCGFKFHSALENAEYKDFTIGFVAKLRSKIYHQAETNPSQWYIFKHVSPVQVDVLGKKELLINYGFDYDKFVQSDMFKGMLGKFKAAIKNGIEVLAPKFISSLKSQKEIDEANMFLASIAEGSKLIENPRVNDKYYVLHNLDIGSFDECDKLDAEIDEQLKKKGIYADLSDEGGDMPSPEGLVGDSEQVDEVYHTSVAGHPRDIDEFNPAPEPSAWERDPDYKHINAANFNYVYVAVDADPESKDFGNALFIYRPKKLYSFRRIANVHDEDTFLPVSRPKAEDLKKFISGEAAQFKCFDRSSVPLSQRKMKIVPASYYFKNIQYKKGDVLKKAIDLAVESDGNVKLSESKWDCEVIEKDGKFEVYEKNGHLWAATFGSKAAAEAFAKEYPSMKEKYLKQDRAVESELTNEAGHDELTAYKNAAIQYGDEVFAKMRAHVDQQDSEQAMAWAMFGCAEWLLQNAKQDIFREVGKKVSQIGAGYMI